MLKLCIVLLLTTLSFLILYYVTFKAINAKLTLKAMSKQTWSIRGLRSNKDACEENMVVFEDRDDGFLSDKKPCPCTLTVEPSLCCSMSHRPPLPIDST